MSFVLNDIYTKLIFDFRRGAFLPRVACPALIRSLRVYHDGGLFVDSKHAFAQESRPSSPTRSRHRLSSIHPQAVSCRFSTFSTLNATNNRNSSMSLLDKQFLEALQPSLQAAAARRHSLTPSEILRNKRHSVATVPDLEPTLSRQSTRRDSACIQKSAGRKFWWGDWEAEDEDEFYREALRYDLKR